VQFECFFDRDHCTVNARAVATGRCEQHPLGCDWRLGVISEKGLAHPLILGEAPDGRGRKVR
jgi:hypothetical protein